MLWLHVTKHRQASWEGRGVQAWPCMVVAWRGAQNLLASHHPPKALPCPLARGAHRPPASLTQRAARTARRGKQLTTTVIVHILLDGSKNTAWGFTLSTDFQEHKTGHSVVQGISRTSVAVLTPLMSTSPLPAHWSSVDYCVLSCPVMALSL